MVIYKLTHRTYANGRLADFTLPRTVGYYRTQVLAFAAMDATIKQQNAKATDWADHVTPADYMIMPITVHE
jgi:hypothetical protein